MLCWVRNPPAHPVIFLEHNLIQLSKFEEAKALVFKNDPGALDALIAVLNDDFFHAEALMMLGCQFLARGHHGIAAVLSSAAIDARRAIDGKFFPEAERNLGVSYKLELKHDVAERIWSEALKHETLKRDRAEILTLLSGLYINEGQAEKAVAYCRQALAEDPDCEGAKVNLGLAALELSDWETGWAGFKAMSATGDRRRRVYGKGLPEWKGEKGKVVIVYGDQGVGDELYYTNCLPDLIRDSKRVIFDCHPRLVDTFKRSFPEIEVHGTRKNVSGGMEWVDNCGAECSVPLPDLSTHYRKKTSDWDGKPYLKVDYPIVVGAKFTPRIGISWTGGTKRTRTDLRSLPLAALEPIIRACPEAQWFSLQYTENAAREVCEFEEKTGLRVSHFPNHVECFNYDTTMQFVGLLDLVITVSTTVHHAAGSLGVPVWTLTPSRPSWRYCSDNDRVPWYGSARLFKQESDGDWSGPIERICAEFAEFRKLKAA